jgi:hypothetical protein
MGNISLDFMEFRSDLKPSPASKKAAITSHAAYPAESGK